MRHSGTPTQANAAEPAKPPNAGASPATVQTAGQVGMRNRLLATLEPDDFAYLAPHMTRVPLHMRQTLIESDVPFRDVFFIESGIASILARSDEGGVEIGMIGPEGMAGISTVLGTDRSPNVFLIQAPGEALSLPASILRAAFEARPTLRSLVLRYVQYLMIQTTRTIYANARLGIEARLARWILMTNDRLGTDDLPLTHEFLSMMLGTRRSSITTATHVLEGNGLIKAQRGNIVMRDRGKLEELAGDAYGLAEAEYERLLPPRLPR